jgi:hypothetical protein
MSNRDLLKILDTPEIAIHAHRPEIKRSDAEGLRSNFRVPTIEAPKVQVWRSVRQASRLDGMGIIHQKQEHVAVAGIKRRGILSDVHDQICVMVPQSSTPGTFHMVSPVPLPAMSITAATSS